MRSMLKPTGACAYLGIACIFLQKHNAKTSFTPPERLKLHSRSFCIFFAVFIAFELKVCRVVWQGWKNWLSFFKFIDWLIDLFLSHYRFYIPTKIYGKRWWRAGEAWTGGLGLVCGPGSPSFSLSRHNILHNFRGKTARFYKINFCIN